jgi:hypothetical protein
MPDVLERDSLLVRAPEVIVRLTDDDEVTLEVGGERFDAPRIAVAVLDAFTRPRTVADVLEGLAPNGPEQFLEASGVIVQLQRAGILSGPGAHLRPRARGYVRPSIHIAMLEDRVRTARFCEAIRALVRPSDVVVDIGTGTGVLATCAALAGARKVFAIESTAIAEVAERVFVENEVAERIQLVRERSTHASLPERGQLLVTEMIGNDPLDEHIIEIIADARRRLLVPDARIIPSSIDVLAVPVDIPADLFEKHVFMAHRIEAYRADSGVSLASLLEHTLGPAQPIMIRTSDACSWPPVGEIATVASIDLTASPPVSFQQKLRFEMRVPVARPGVFLAFRTTLAPGLTLSTMPGEVDPRNHWRYAMWPALDLRDLPRGAVIEADYAYDRGTSSFRFSRTG